MAEGRDRSDRENKKEMRCFGTGKQCPLSTVDSDDSDEETSLSLLELSDFRTKEHSKESIKDHDRPRPTTKQKNKSVSLNRKKTSVDRDKEGKKKRRFWTFRLKPRSATGHGGAGAIPKTKELIVAESSPLADSNGCICTVYRRTEDHVLGPGIVFGATASCSRSASSHFSSISSHSLHSSEMGATGGRCDLCQIVPPPAPPSIIDLSRFNPEDYPTEDIDELIIAKRAWDIEHGIEISPSHVAYPHLRCGSSSSSSNDDLVSLSSQLAAQCTIFSPPLPHPLESRLSASFMAQHQLGAGSSNSLAAGPYSESQYNPPVPYHPRTIHTQVDYIHCLVPDLNKIAACCFYWGVMDRYEAERLLDNKPEGTFLLRDSAQEEFLFSVSFRRYGRSLHARIEQWNHKFSFDSHDPGVFAADTVCGLIKHYKDPSSCMFFEPMLTIPLNRSFSFSLQHLCRATLCRFITYDDINFLPLPKSMREYLRYYHYKQKVRVRRFEMSH